MEKINDKLQLEKAAEELYSDYIWDNELTAFETLDFEDFHGLDTLIN